MSEEFQEHIFEAFSREQSGVVSDIQGTGLGMAITKNIVDMLGGTITVNSKKGEGSEFVVDIPCKISKKCLKKEHPAELRGKKVLVVDENRDSCDSICDMLSDIGMIPEYKHIGDEAVERAREALDSGDKFDAYIIDLLLPNTDGINTTRRIREIVGNNEPIIIVSAYDWSDIETEARNAGVTRSVPSRCLYPSSKKLFRLISTTARSLCLKRKKSSIISRVNVCSLSRITRRTSL